MPTLLKSLLSTLWLLLAAVNCYAQDELLLNGDHIPGIDTTWVFTPDTYQANDGSYPVVYLLHGYSSNFRQWHQIMNAQDYANRYQMVLVCPDGFYNSWYINSPNLSDSQFSDFFFEALMTEIESNYRIDPTKRFITGLSMGGHGAFHLFSLRPELFASAGSTSGVMDLKGSAGLFELIEHLGRLEDNEAQWLSFSAIGNLDQIAESKKELIFDCGTEDPFYRWNQQFYELCLERKIPVTFISQPGQHDWDYWAKSIRAHFDFFSAKLK